MQLRHFNLQFASLNYSHVVLLTHFTVQGPLGGGTLNLMVNPVFFFLAGAAADSSGPSPGGPWSRLGPTLAADALRFTFACGCRQHAC